MSQIAKDTSCVSALSAGVYVYGKMVHAQRLLHRLDTRKGELRWSPGELDFGIKLSDEIGKATTQWQENALPDLIRTELSKDRAVESVSVKMRTETEGAGKKFYFAISVVTVDGPLELNVVADDSSLAFLGAS